MTRIASRKILIYIGVTCLISIGSIVSYVAYSSKYDNIQDISQTADITEKKSATMLSTEASAQIVTTGFADLSLKGYLTTSDNIGIPNENIQVSLKGIRIDDKQTKEENTIVGNSTTDQNGCFYFNGWNNDLNKTLGNISQSNNVASILSFTTKFTGTNELSPSSNTTEVKFSSVIPSMERPAIGTVLSNSTALVQDINLKRGNSYDYKLFVFRGNSNLFSPEEELLKLDIKGLPCGVVDVFENDVADLTEQYNATTHLKIFVDKNAKAGEYYYFVMGNNLILREARLIVE